MYANFIKKAALGSPGFDTILKVIAAFGLTLRAEAAHADDSTARGSDAANR
jgi:hypothetical protein